MTLAEIITKLRLIHKNPGAYPNENLRKLIEALEEYEALNNPKGIRLSQLDNITMRPGKKVEKI